MASHSSFETVEPGRAEAFLARSYADLRLRLPDDQPGFRFADSRLDAGSFRFDQIAIAAGAGFAYRTQDVFCVSVVRAGTLRFRRPVCGIDEVFGRGEVALIGRPRIEAITEVDHFRQDAITIRASSLREAAGLDPGDELPIFTSVRPLSPGRAATWRRGLDLVAGMLHGDPAVAESPVVLGSAERMLSTLLLATFPNTAVTDPGPRDRRDARDPDVLRRAIAFIDSNVDVDIGIADVADAAGVSRRTVQLAFRRHLDTTPTAYLRRLRLDHAHRELLAAGPDDGLTVTDVAFRWGFSSASRFAERYREAFGVPPSRTLRR